MTTTSDREEDVRAILRKMQLPEAGLFDQSASGDDIYADELRPDLSEEEIEDAMWIRRFVRGVMLVVGDPGSGKGLFGNVLAWKIKRLFGNRKVLLDYRPKKPFGLYLPFDDQFLSEELGKMAELSNVRIGEIPEEIDRKDKKKLKDISGLAEKWVRSKEGEIYLSNSVLVLEEFKRYMHNRRPMNPLGITLGHIITWWRHLDILILGMTPFKREIDAISCLPYVTHEVRCSWQANGVAKCRVYQTQWVGSKGVLRMEGIPTTVRVDGWKERPEIGINYVELGEGIDSDKELSKYTNVSDYGYAVLGTIGKYCKDNDDGKVLFSTILAEVGLEEGAVVDTLEKLSKLGVIDIHYYRYFDLYNSKFLPSITPTGR